MIGLFDDDELCLIVDALDGVAIDDTLAIESLRLILLAKVEDALRIDELDAKWGVDRDALLAKLDVLDDEQTRRVLEGARHFWSLGLEADDTTAELIVRSFEA